MKLKLDENLGTRWLLLFQEYGLDADTVQQERLTGSNDATIFDTCIREQRCLVSLDLDFADVIRFPPTHSAGIAILRPPKGNSRSILESLVRSLVAGLQHEEIKGRLWVVEPGRIRIHAAHDD